MIQSLRLQQFRCFEQINLDFSPHGAVFLGNNAQGKTSLLEAICLILRLHSPRTRNPRQMIRFENAGFGLSAQVGLHEQQVRYHTRNGIQLRLDGLELDSHRDYLEQSGLLVWMGNEDMELIRGVSASRRRYLDFLGTQLHPSYRRALGRYQHALKSRNALLKEANPSRSSIEAYSSILLQQGELIQETRRQLINQLQALVEQAHADIGGQLETLSLIYKPGAGENFATSLYESLDRDLRTGQTHRGPHRDDLGLHLQQKSAQDFASEGQQRTLSIALKLAQGRLLQEHGKRPPIYLIDDVFGELDQRRRQALIQHLPDNAQVFITTTQMDWLQETPLNLPKFLVHDGKVNPS